MEWSRPRVSLSPYDQHMTDPAHDYRFFVKLFQGLEDRPDPVSESATVTSDNLRLDLYVV